MDKTYTQQEMRQIMLEWRGIYFEEDACTQCDGSGIKTYGNTSTWRHGIGGQAMTIDVCDVCWGSGQKHVKFTNLKTTPNESE